MKTIHGLILFLSLTATVAFAQSSTNFELTSGQTTQTVKAGELIEPIVFKAANVDSVVSTLLPGLTCDCDTPKNPKTCTVSGRIPASASGKTYNMKLDAYGTTAGDDISAPIAITITPMSSPLERISGNLDQTATAGDSITPIVFRYQNLHKIGFTGQPKGITVNYDEDDWTISIYGAPDETLQDKEYNYRLVVYSTDVDSVVVNGKITVNHKPAVTTLEIVENESQNITAGDSIKPIVLKFSNMQYREVSGVPQGTSVVQDDEKQTITITGLIPENHSDKVYTVTVIAHGLDNNVTVNATINVTHKVAAAKVTLISNNATQTVKAGSAIDPLVFKYEHIQKLEPTDLPAGNFSTSQDVENNTVTIKGTVSENAAPGEYKVKVTGKGESNDDIAYATIIVESQKATVSLFQGKESQTVSLGDSIEPVVFKYAFTQGITVNGSVPKGVEYSQDADAHTITFFGKINDDNSAKEYVFGLKVEGNSTTDSAKAKIIVTNKTESSSSITSSVSQSSESRSSSSAKSSSSVKSSSSTEIAANSSSSRNDKSSSSSTKNDKKSSSSNATSSSSQKTTDIKLVMHDVLNFSYANNELAVSLETPAATHVQIFDMMGHLLETHELQSSANIHLGHLPRGTMLVRIFSSGFAKTARVIIK